MFANMGASKILDERHVLSEDTFVETVVRRLAGPLAGSRHLFKYRLALISKGVCVLRYDNETGKGDYKHLREKEFPFIFTTPEKLLDDFWADVDQWRA
jgi:hypothetical protein